MFLLFGKDVYDAMMNINIAHVCRELPHHDI